MWFRKKKYVDVSQSRKIKDIIRKNREMRKKLKKKPAVARTLP
jgi:hypothetical protein